MKHIKYFENDTVNDEKLFRDLSRNEPDYKKGDYVKFIGPYKKRMNITYEVFKKI